MSCQRTSCYQGRTDGLNVMTDTQRASWLQRKDGWVECQTHREHHGQRKDRWVECHVKEHLVTEEGQVG